MNAKTPTIAKESSRRRTIALLPALDFLSTFQIMFNES